MAIKGAVPFFALSLDPDATKESKKKIKSLFDKLGNKP